MTLSDLWKLKVISVTYLLLLLCVRIFTRDLLATAKFFVFALLSTAVSFEALAIKEGSPQPYRVWKLVSKKQSPWETRRWKEQDSTVISFESIPVCTD